MKHLGLNIISTAIMTVLVLFGNHALASTQTGKLSITVTNQTDKVLVGAIIKLSSKDLIGGVREVTSDEKGMYRFIQLPPGLYDVAAQKQGFRRMSLTGIAVEIGRTSHVKLALVPMTEEDDAEEIVVKGRAMAIDTENMTLGDVISDTFAETVPTGRSYQDMADLVPGVVDSDGDGNPNILGSTDYDNQYLIDGINISDPVLNTFSANLNFDAIKSVEVLIGGRDAEYGSATGGVINVVTKSGSNELHLDASVYYSSNKLQYKEEGEEDLTNSRLKANLNLGGPILRDTLWYFASVEVPYNVSTMSEPEGGTLFPDREDKKHPSRVYKGINTLAKLTWQVTSDQLVKILFQMDPAVISNSEQDPAYHPDAESEQTQGGFILAAISETFLTPELLWNNKLSYKTMTIGVHPQSGNLDIPGRQNIETSTYTMNYKRNYDDSRIRIQAHSSLSYTLDDLWGEHQFKTGVDFSYFIKKNYDSLTGGGFYQDNGLDPNNLMSISTQGIPYRYEQLIQPEDTRYTGDTEGIYIQDVWKPIDAVVIRPGLRYDSSRMKNHKGVTQVNINSISPRIGVAWDPFDDGRTALRAGYYQYVDTGVLSLSSFAGGFDRLTRTYEYNDNTGEYDQFLRQTGGESAHEARDYLKKPFNQHRPRTHEMILGLSRALADDIGLSIDFTYRYSGQRWEDDEINLIWNQDGTDVIGFVNGEPRYIYSLGALNDAFSRYYGVECAVDKSFSRKWQMKASYTWARTEGTTPSFISGALDNPRQREFEFGYLPQDIRHVMKVFASYALPAGFVLGGKAQWISGAPYDRFFMNDYYGGYYNRQTSRGYDTVNGEKKQLRLPSRFTLNLRAMWRAKELTGLDLELIAEIYNVFNNRAATSVEQNNLPAGSPTQFGQILGKLKPLNAEVGIRFRY